MSLNVNLDYTYAGQFEAVGQEEDGTVSFESIQSVEVDSLPKGLTPDFEVNAVKWSVAPNGKLKGTARFLRTSTYDLVTATLEGHTPPPPQGQKYRDAFVEVTFTGGTGGCSSAHGKAQVEAKLYDDGRSRGALKGVINLPASDPPGEHPASEQK